MPTSPGNVLGGAVVLIIFVLIFKACQPKQEQPQGLTDNQIRWIHDSTEQATKRIHDSLIAAEERRPKTKEEIRLYKTVSKYRCTPEQAKNILNHKVSIGMTKEMAKAAVGRPDNINTTQGRTYVHEQWVYGDFPDATYLYFDNGILTTFQNSQ